MIPKFKGILLSLALVACCVSVASAAPSALAADKATAGATKECVAAIKKALPELNKAQGATMSVSIPGCGTLESGVLSSAAQPDDALIAAAKGITPSATGCNLAGGYTSYRNIFRVELWRVTSRTNFCYDTGANRITFYDNPPTVTVRTTLGWGFTPVSRQSQWVSEPRSAMGTTNTTVYLGFQGTPVSSFSVQHEMMIYSNGTATFTPTVG